MVQLLNYSVNTVEQLLLLQLESCPQSFSFSQKAALAITAIFTHCNRNARYCATDYSNNLSHYGEYCCPPRSIS